MKNMCCIIVFMKHFVNVKAHSHRTIFPSVKRAIFSCYIGYRYFQVPFTMSDFLAWEKKIALAGKIAEWERACIQMLCQK